MSAKYGKKMMVFTHFYNALTLSQISVIHASILTTFYTFVPHDTLWVNGLRIFQNRQT